MDADKQRELYEDKYQAKIGVSYGDWMESAPSTETEAYAYCQNLDEELKNTYEEWFNSTGEQREELENYRERLKLEYDLVEELYGLELHDK